MRNSCPCPSGCIVGERIEPCEPEDGVRVICTNPQCQAGLWVHAICFHGWEAELLAQLNKSPSPATEDGVWSLAGQGGLGEWRGCECGSGLLQKDLDYHAPAPVHDEGFTKAKGRNRRRTNSRQQPSSTRPSNPPPPPNSHQLGPRLRNRAASLGSGAVGIAGSEHHQTSPPHSFGAFTNHRRERQRSETGPGSEFFTDYQVGKTGSIFARREGLNTLYAALPRWKVNGFHIKLEDDCPQGNDDTRIFLLTTLGDHKMRQIKCILCSTEIKVYDKYPLLDGTFFLSPVNHNGEGLPVRYDTRDSFLHAMCVRCLETGCQRLSCARCGGGGWFPGASLLLGSLYAYDILSSSPCCPPECRQCHQPLPLPDPSLHQYRHYSAFSEISNCQKCGHRDSHYIRRLDTMRLSGVGGSSSSSSSTSGLSPASLPSHSPGSFPLHHMITA